MQGTFKRSIQTPTPYPCKMMNTIMNLLLSKPLLGQVCSDIKSNLEVLATRNSWYSDGTFKNRPRTLLPADDRIWKNNNRIFNSSCIHRVAVMGVTTKPLRSKVIAVKILQI